ncbi:CHAT domain-containing protein [Pseudonocardia saturnea]
MERPATIEVSADRLGLLPMSLSRPHEAMRLARQQLTTHPTHLDASVARQAIGIVLRDFGDSRAAVRELRRARQLARTAGSVEREADVCATLGLALVFGGHTARGFGVLDEAVELAEGVQAGRILMRRGSGWVTLGEYEAALRDLKESVRILRHAEDMLWLPRALTARAFTYLALGSVDRARSDMVRAEQMLAAGGQELEWARARQNRGVVAFRDGDLPAALDCLDAAGERFGELGVTDPEWALDRCNVLLAAGLPADALRAAEETLAHLENVGATGARYAEILLAAATAALAGRDPITARQRAAQARRAFSRQRRAWWEAQARLVELRARHDSGEVSARLLSEAARCAAALDRWPSTDAALAHLLAGRVALGLGRPEQARVHLSTAARGRHRGPAGSRVVGWLAEALHAEADGDTRRLLHACRRGLAAIDELRDSMRSSELRAHVTRHGGELALVALRHIARSGSARRMLEWSERWRGSALVPTSVRPPVDPAMRADLAALREITSRTDGEAPQVLRREQARLERAIRARAMRAAGAGSGGPDRVDLDALFDELGTARLVQLVDVDGTLHVLIAGAGRVHRRVAGPTARAVREVDLARFGLKRVLQRPGAAAVDLLAAARPLLSSALFGDSLRELGDADVVVVPPGILHAVPWAMVPELDDRALSVAPSAAAWLRARRAPPAPSDRVVLVHGPGLAMAAAEVAELSRGYPGARVLGSGTATSSAVLAALDGADLVHIAAHGSFRSDSPLFSSLRLDDGPLTVHDLEQLHRAPRRMVLPSCESALLSPAGSDELLGLTSSLLPLGTVGVVAGVVPISDDATFPMMTRLHAHLRDGRTLADALRRARPGPDADPLSIATGWSFISLGAG